MNDGNVVVRGDVGVGGLRETTIIAKIDSGGSIADCETTIFGHFNFGRTKAEDSRKTRDRIGFSTTFELEQEQLRLHVHKGESRDANTFPCRSNLGSKDVIPLCPKDFHPVRYYRPQIFHLEWL